MSRFLDRPLSWSQLQSFHYNPDDWYASYVLGERQAPNSLMLAGSRIGDAIGTPDSPIEELSDIGVKEYTVKATIDGIPIVGHLDGWDSTALTLSENKCSDKKGRWTQGKADKHGQIDMYLILLREQDGVDPESVTSLLNFIHLKQTGVDYAPSGQWRQFTTKRTREQLDCFIEDMKQTVELMERYIENQRILGITTPRPPAFKGI